MRSFLDYAGIPSMFLPVSVPGAPGWLAANGGIRGRCLGGSSDAVLVSLKDRCHLGLFLVYSMGHLLMGLETMLHYPIILLLLSSEILLMVPQSTALNW